jgi:hypothetical protein
MPFPPRTAASDAIARNLYRALKAAADRVPEGGVNRCMVTVVTVNEVGNIPSDAYVATSGKREISGGLRVAINNQTLHGIFARVVYHIAAFTGAESMIYPLGSAFPRQSYKFADGRMVDNIYLIAGGRHCAEPKAIEPAAKSGKVLSGMTTFWWGNISNPYADPDDNPTKIFALPCEVCRANEGWIMARAEEARVKAKTGGPGRPLDV